MKARKPKGTVVGSVKGIREAIAEGDRMVMAAREIHTSDLTEPCRRKVQLRREGKVIGAMPSALYRGQLFAEALRLLHTTHGFAWSPTMAIAGVTEAHGAVEANAVRENRPLTKAVLGDLPDIQAEVAKLLGLYPERMAERFDGATMIGCELPCRMTLIVDGEPAVFASHIDFMWKNRAGGLELYDHKSGADAPTYDYLSRNVQLGTYALMVYEGEIDVAGGLGEWLTFGAWPEVAWVHLNDLAPYSRKTTVKENGADVVYTAGQHRPIDRIVRYADIHLGGIERIKEELAVRVRMDRAGLYPTAPDPIGCMHCESKRFCDNFSERVERDSDSF